jgi:hypothetical protein
MSDEEFEGADAGAYRAAESAASRGKETSPRLSFKKIESFIVA